MRIKLTADRQTNAQTSNSSGSTFRYALETVQDHRRIPEDGHCQRKTNRQRTAVHVVLLPGKINSERAYRSWI